MSYVLSKGQVRHRTAIAHQPIVWFHPLEFAERGGTKDAEDVDFNRIIHSALPSTQQHLRSIS